MIVSQHSVSIPINISGFYKNGVNDSIGLKHLFAVTVHIIPVVNDRIFIIIKEGILIRMIGNNIYSTDFVYFKWFSYRTIPYSITSVGDVIFYQSFMSCIDRISNKGNVFLVKIIQARITH